MEDLSPFRSDLSRSSTGEEATSWPGGPSWLSAEGGAGSCSCVCPYRRYQMKVWMTRRRGILGRKPTLFPSPRTSSADTEHNGELFYRFYRFHGDFSTVRSDSTGNRLEVLLSLAAASLSVGFALELRRRRFSRQLLPGSLLRVLQAEGEKRTLQRSETGWGSETRLAPRCSPRSWVRTGDLEADLLDGSVHDFIVGLDGRMDHQLNLHSSNMSPSLVCLCVCRVAAFPSFCQAPSWRCRPE